MASSISSSRPGSPKFLGSVTARQLAHAVRAVTLGDDLGIVSPQRFPNVVALDPEGARRETDWQGPRSIPGPRRSTPLRQRHAGDGPLERTVDAVRPRRAVALLLDLGREVREGMRRELMAVERPEKEILPASVA